MKPVVDWLHARGLKFGLYSSMGNETCNNNGRTWPGNATGTWPRHGSFGYYKEDAQTFADWGVDYVKVCERCSANHRRRPALLTTLAPLNPSHAHPPRCCFLPPSANPNAINRRRRRLTTGDATPPRCLSFLSFKMDWCGKTFGHTSEELHRNFSHWLNATGRPMHLELCRGYEKHPIPDYVAEVAQSWRVAGDNWDFWPHTVETIKDFINVSHLAGPYNWNYGDFLMTGGAGCNNFEAGDHCAGQTDAEYRTQFSVYAIAASPLIIGTDIRNMTQIMKDALLNKELLAVNQDFEARAGDLVATYPAAQCGSTGAGDARRACRAHVLVHSGMADAGKVGTCSVTLTKQLSNNHPCVSGASAATFGCFDSNKTMFVSEGCRGVFECDGNTVSCDPDGSGGRHFCDCLRSTPTPAPGPGPVDGDVLLWARHLSDGSVAIAVTNLDASAHDVIVPLSTLGWADAGAVSVRDLWALKDLGTTTATVNVTVSSHDTAVLKLRKA